MFNRIASLLWGIAITACAMVPAAMPAAVAPVATLASSSTATLTPTATFTPTSTLTPTATAEPTATLELSPTPTEITILWPTPDGDARSRLVRLSILMYHYVEPWPPNADEARKSLTVRPEDFALQMQYLAENGYTTVSLYDLVDALALGRALPERAVVLTFDDGYRGLMDYALPVTQRYGFTGTVFVITDFSDYDLPAYLNWTQIKQLYALGWRIEPHTKTHLTLASRTRDKQVYEMLGSIETIEANLGVRPRFFCYPVGKYDELTVQLAYEMNLWGGVTTHGGRLHTYDNRFTWSRMRVDGRGSLKDFIYAVEGDLK